MRHCSLERYTLSYSAGLNKVVQCHLKVLHLPSQSLHISFFTFITHTKLVIHIFMVKVMKVCIKNLVWVVEVGDQMECGVIERVQNSILRWFVYVERIPDSSMKTVYLVDATGWILIKWKDRVLELEKKRKGRHENERIGACNSTSGSSIRGSS